MGHFSRALLGHFCQAPKDHGTEQNPDDETLATELKFYLSLYDKLQALDPNFPPNHVERVYKKLKRAAEGIAN